MGVNFLGNQDFAKKRFFWCTADNMKFSELPEPLSAKCRPVFDQIQSVFTGEFDKTIVEGSGISQFVFLDKDLLSKCKIPHRGITELDRLSHVVHQIDSDCSIVPKGAIKKIPLKETRVNEAFKGLKAGQAFDISSYCHFRAPQDKAKVDMNARNQGVYNNDFMDEACSDLPVGTWSMLKDTSGAVSVMRSKLWPGFYSYHKVNTRIHGCFYVGNGCKALDMAFMF